jgi:uncharacterized protein (TIGR02466 family)
MQEQLFATPIWHFQHPDPQACQALAAHVLALEDQDPAGLQRTNQGGWHSSTALLDDPVLADLFHWIAACCQGAVQDWGWDLNQATPTFNNAWAMVNRRGHSTRAHLHPNSLLSGGGSSAGARGFWRHRLSGSPRRSPDVGAPWRSEAPDALGGRVRRLPALGRMVLFPAWLWHEVEPSSQDGERIAISFNIGMRAKVGA